MMDGSDSTTPTRHRVDWRGWVALAWVLGWGWAYGVMVFHARGQQVLAWLSQCGLALHH
jgi:hypothetical protein